MDSGLPLARAIMPRTDWFAADASPPPSRVGDGLGQYVHDCPGNTSQARAVNPTPETTLTTASATDG